MRRLIAALREPFEPDVPTSDPWYFPGDRDRSVRLAATDRHVYWSRLHSPFWRDLPGWHGEQQDARVCARCRDDLDLDLAPDRSLAEASAPARRPGSSAGPLGRRLAGQRGQAIVELALVTPVIALLILGAADLGYRALHVALAQNAAGSVAGLMAQDVPRTDSRVEGVLARAGGCEVVDVTGRDPLVVVEVRCPVTSITSLLPPTVEASASAVRPAPAATPMPPATPLPPATPIPPSPAP